MDMTLQYYNQPHITVEEQIQLLKSEGLLFENERGQRECLDLSGSEGQVVGSQLELFPQNEGANFKNYKTNAYLQAVNQQN